MNNSKKIFKISFLGDISLNGVYEEMYLNKKNPFNNFSDTFKDDELIIGNLECFARGNNGINELKKPILETSLETLNYLTSFNLGVACLANNHVFDHLEDGFEKSVKFLSENKIKTLGASLLKKEYSKPLILEENGIKVGILNYVTKDTNPNPPEGTKINLNWFDIDKTIFEIDKVNYKVNHLVVVLHWGGRVEGGLYPDFDQPKIARKLIDAGADLIIGHHSHTVHPFEIYKGKHIFYSLGNFCFSDFIFEGENHFLPKRRKHSLVVSVKFNKNDYKVSTNFFFNNINKIVKMEGYSKSLVFRNFIFKHFLKYHFFWKIYYFNHLKIIPIILYLNRNDMTIVEKFRRLNFKKLKKYLFK